MFVSLKTLSGTIYLGVYSVGVYTSPATDFGSGEAHTYPWSTTPGSLQCGSLHFSGYGIWIWTSTYLSLIHTHRGAYNGGVYIVCESTILGQPILNLKKQIHIHMGVYSVGVYSSRATDFGSGQAHPHTHGSLQCGSLQSVSLQLFSRHGFWIWTRTYPFFKTIKEDPSTCIV